VWGVRARQGVGRFTVHSGGEVLCICAVVYSSVSEFCGNRFISGTNVSSFNDDFSTK
jgi:hypothetical protein